MQYTASGSYLVFGTSNNYASGITNRALLFDQNGSSLFSGPTAQFNGSVSITGACGVGGNHTVSGQIEIGNGDPYLRIHRHGVVYWDVKALGDGACGIYNNSGAWGWYSVGGTLHVPGNVVAYWSDARLKENVEDLDGYEARIMGLRPVSFEWNKKGRKRTGKGEGQREIGFIAQEVQEVCPQFVGENKTPSDDDDTVYLTVQKDQMIADLVAQVQSLTRRIAKLEGN
jgi:hypothetical protein